jgi:hypothetical protein
MEFPWKIPWKNIMKKSANVYEKFHRIPWKIPLNFMKLRLMEFHGIQLNSMENSMEFHGIPWDSVN